MITLGFIVVLTAIAAYIAREVAARQPVDVEYREYLRRKWKEGESVYVGRQKVS